MMESIQFNFTPTDKDMKCKYIIYEDCPDVMQWKVF